MLAWLLSTPATPPQLVRALRRAAEGYHRRARWISRSLSVYLPLWLTTAAGGVAVALYALSLVAPWSQILIELAQP